MATEVRHLIDAAQPYPVVRLVGVLDADTAAQVRAVLLDELARQPEALVVDVCDLAVADPAAAQVLRDVTKEAAAWPAATVALCAPTGDDLWQSTGLPVWPSLAEAMAALGDPEPVRRRSIELEPVVGAARRARELVTEACVQWDQAELAGPVCIVVTEMVNNVVAHAQTSMRVQLALRGDAFTVAVRDHSPTVPQFTGPVAPTSYGGRGLLLIDSVARRWGSLQLDDGKVVWAVLHRDDETMDVPLGSGEVSAGTHDRP
jgi:hypothetical protein